MDAVINWPAPAKLNLFLYINNQRKVDNYHNLQTLFQLLDFGDTLTFTVRQDAQLRLLKPIEGVLDETNLILIAARLLQAHAIKNKLFTAQILGADILINKKIPMGAGLGGGSSNAATTLVALNHYWRLNLSIDELVLLGRQVGADVPVFIMGRSAFAEGIGDVLMPIALPAKWFLVVTPRISISTKTIFSHPSLPRSRPPQTVNQCLTANFANDCEVLVRMLYPALNQLMNEVSTLAPVCLTGTGSAFFSTFDDQNKAEEIQKKLPQACPSFISQGSSVSPLTNHRINT